MKKIAILIFVLITSCAVLAWAESKLYVFGEGAVLSGFYVINKATGERLGYVAIATDGQFEMTIELELVPVYLADPEPDPEPDPDPTWIPTKDNAFQTSCDNCHREENDDKYKYMNWNKASTDWTTTIDVPKDKAVGGG